MKNEIKSQIEVIAINQVRQNLEQIKNEYFSKNELFELKNKHIQTLAGFYTLKVALKKLINKQYPNQTVSEKQIILTHNANGAPCISEITSILNDDIKKFQISISHTSENIYGFATIMEIMK